MRSPSSDWQDCSKLKMTRLISNGCVLQISSEIYLKVFRTRRLKQIDPNGRALYNSAEIRNLKNKLDILLVIRHEDNRYDEEYRKNKRVYNRLLLTT